jgi:hypothetical protein
MARAKRSTTRVVYQIKVTLKGSKPSIWRRMQVTSETTLAQLHQILQCVMGWEGYHLYQFVVGGIQYSDPSILEEMEGEDARRVTLASLVRGEKDTFLYEYDFGDGWDHELLIEKILPPEAGKRYPACLAGKRACPPEDCGGILGYAGFLEALHDPKHPEHGEMLEWVGGEFDPDALDLDEVNTELQNLK